MATGKTALVVVLGEIGQSPRMLNHVHEVQKYFDLTYVLGYGELHDPVAQSTKFVPIKKVTIVGKLFMLSIISTLAKACLLALNVLDAMLHVDSFPDLIIVQVPPFYPIIPILSIASFFYGSKFVVDWHNLPFTILRCNNRLPAPIVALSSLGENWTCNWTSKFVDLWHVCVSARMARYLQEAYGFASRQTLTLLDGVCSWKLGTAATPFCGILDFDRLKKEKFLIITSTSWTNDENLNLLLDALVILQRDGDIPKDILVVATGNGPNRDSFQRLCNENLSDRVTLMTAWLPTSEYFNLLGASDLGMCFHTSTSGMDIPMKIIDMISVGIPVAAYGYECLQEISGATELYLFQNAEDLALIISARLRQQERTALKGAHGKWEKMWTRTFSKIIAL